MGLHGYLSAGRRGLCGAYRVLWLSNKQGSLSTGSPVNKGCSIRWMYRRGALFCWTCSSTRDFCGIVGSAQFC